MIGIMDRARLAVPAERGGYVDAAAYGACSWSAPGAQGVHVNGKTKS
jgi:hypothetical protein